MGSDSAPITVLLSAWREGDKQALDHLMPLVYDELHRLARAHMHGEARAITLQPTLLVHEAYDRLIGAAVDWQDRLHFFAIAARVMRRIMVEHARKRAASKRGGGQGAEPLDEAIPAPGQEPDIEALHQALERLAAADERKAQVVELHYFGGMTYDELAQHLGISAATVDRELRFAKAWLKQRLVEVP